MITREEAARLSEEEQCNCCAHDESDYKLNSPCLRCYAGQEDGVPSEWTEKKGI